MTDGPGPRVGIVGGSRSDFPILMDAQSTLEMLEIPCELRVVSAHRTPDQLFRYAETAEGRGIRVIVAGAGGAAHLPGMLAAKTALPVIGVPIPTKQLGGLDSLLSIVQMPRGDPGRDRRDRQRDECGTAGGGDPRPRRSRAGGPPRGLPRRSDPGCPRGPLERRADRLTPTLAPLTEPEAIDE